MNMFYMMWHNRGRFADVRCCDTCFSIQSPRPSRFHEPFSELKMAESRPDLASADDPRLSDQPQRNSSNSLQKPSHSDDKVSFFSRPTGSNEPSQPFQPQLNSQAHAIHTHKALHALQGRRKDMKPFHYMLQPFLGQQHKASVGECYVKVVQAKHLPALDMFSSDPYVTVSLGYGVAQQTAKTTVKKVTCKPEWNEEFLFTLTNTTQTLKFTVFDRYVSSCYV